MGRGWMQEYWFCYFLSLDCDFLGASSGKWLVHFQIYIYIFFILSKNTYNNTNIHQSYRYTYTHVFLYMFVSISTYIYIYICSTHIYLIYPSLHQQKKSINFFGELSLRLDRPRWWFQSSNWIFGVKITKDLCVATPHEFIKNRKKRPLWSFFGCFFVMNLDNVFFLKPPPSDSCLLKAGVQSSTETHTLEKKKVLWTQRYRSELLEVDRSGEKKVDVTL